MQLQSSVGEAVTLKIIKVHIRPPQKPQKTFLVSCRKSQCAQRTITRAQRTSRMTQNHILHYSKREANKHLADYGLFSASYG